MGKVGRLIREAFEREDRLIRARRRDRIRRILVEEHLEVGEVATPRLEAHIAALTDRIMEAWEDELPLS